MSQPTTMIYINDRDSLVKEYKYHLQRKYKIEHHIHFLSECQKEQLLPTFTRIMNKVQYTLKLSEKEVRNHRERKLQNALNAQNNDLYYTNDKILYTESKLGKFMSESEIKKQYSIFLNQIIKLELNNDQKREIKLEKLRNFSKNLNCQNFERIQIHNYSKTNIPTDNLDFLSRGLQTGIGGVPNTNLILSKFESFFSAWQKHAVTKGLYLIKITEIKSLLFLEFLKLCKCTSDSENPKKLKKFLAENEDLLICVIDKSKDLAIYDKIEYIKKLDNVYEPGKFERLNTNPIKTDLRDLKILVSDFGEYLTKTDQRIIDPTQSLKKGYGLIKMHRLGEPVRPIVSSFNSLTSGSEEFLLNLIKPILAQCKFSINSTKSFKQKFCAIKDKFDDRIHEIVSFDATSLYSNINVKRTVKYIVNQIYLNINDFFPITEETPVAPPKGLTEKFMLDILLKYNSFETLGGFYRQRSGVSMGGKLSGALASIFVNMLEEKILPKYVKNNKLLLYVRFVDDCLLIVRKRNKSQILEEFNKFDKDLKWTVEEMTNGQLTYLDTDITLEESALNLYQHRKPNSDSLTNFKFSVAPKAYKLGLIAGEVHRANNCTSNEKTLDLALDNLEKILQKNSYPKKLVKEKIREIKNRNFTSSEFKQKRNAEFNDPNITHVTISLPYTSFRCSKVASSIHKILHKYTPNFKLRFAFRTIKLSSLITPHLKPRTDYFHTSNLVYKFECECSSTYIGHTKQLFEYRIYGHKNDSNSHVNKHITNCQFFKQNFFENYGTDFGATVPNGNANREYMKSHFTILQRNLHNYHLRTTHEGLLITLHNPDLNKQVFHKSMSFVCECGNYKIENAVGT